MTPLWYGIGMPVPDPVFPDPPAIRIELKTARPIELEDLSVSLRAVGDEYRRWLAEHSETATTQDIRLYVSQIRSGSIIADLVALAPYALPFMENTGTVVEFTKYLRGAYEWLMRGDSPPSRNLSTANLTNLSDIVEPIAKDGSSQVNIGAINVNAPINITLNSEAANAVQNRARRQIENTKAPEIRAHSKVVLYWYQARNDATARTGDKAIIESISPRPVKAVFVDDVDKARMILDEVNPFRHAYVVDVTVETVGGKPALFRITAVHEAIELPPTSESPHLLP